MAQATRQAVELHWQPQGNRLSFKGNLTRETVNSFWPQREGQLQGIRILDVSELEYVDSYGLALLVNMMLSASGDKLQLSGVSSHLQTLIQLYDLTGLLFLKTDL